MSQIEYKINELKEIIKYWETKYRQEAPLIYHKKLKQLEEKKKELQYNRGDERPIHSYQ